MGFPPDIKQAASLFDRPWACDLEKRLARRKK
jgi:hypothetical protein